LAYKPSSITLRPPCLQNGNGHSGGVPIPLKYEVTIKLPEAVHKLAVAAAKRRRSDGFGGQLQQMTVESLCAQIVVGVLCRGSITAALRAFGDYSVDGRCGGNYRIAADPNEPDESSTGIELAD
jgi:hypothetical protein